MPIERFKAAPLSSGFMLASMFGFLFSIIYLSKYSLEWSFAFSFLFFVMFVASFISMINANPDAQLAAIPKKRRK